MQEQTASPGNTSARQASAAGYDACNNLTTWSLPHSACFNNIPHSAATATELKTDFVYEPTHSAEFGGACLTATPFEVKTPLSLIDHPSQESYSTSSCFDVYQKQDSTPDLVHTGSTISAQCSELPTHHSYQQVYEYVPSKSVIPTDTPQEIPLALDDGFASLYPEAQRVLPFYPSRGQRNPSICSYTSSSDAQSRSSNTLGLDLGDVANFRGATQHSKLLALTRSQATINSTGPQMMVSFPDTVAGSVHSPQHLLPPAQFADFSEAACLGNVGSIAYASKNQTRASQRSSPESGMPPEIDYFSHNLFSAACGSARNQMSPSDVSDNASHVSPYSSLDIQVSPFTSPPRMIRPLPTPRRFSGSVPYASNNGHACGIHMPAPPNTPQRRCSAPAAGFGFSDGVSKAYVPQAPHHIGQCEDFEKHTISYVTNMLNRTPGNSPPDETIFGNCFFPSPSYDFANGGTKPLPSTDSVIADVEAHAKSFDLLLQSKGYPLAAPRIQFQESLTQQCYQQSPTRPRLLKRSLFTNDKEDLTSIRTPPGLRIPRFSSDWDSRAPPQEDFQTADLSMVPRAQAPRFPSDMYTPRWIRGKGNTKEGWCGHCEGQGKWLVLKSSAYWYHKHYTHGIVSVTGDYCQSPLETRSTPSAGKEGFCHSCQSWIKMESIRGCSITSVPWFKHAHKCHRYNRHNLDTPSSLERGS